MEFKGYVKSTCEKYDLRFKHGDYAFIVIDETGMFNCQSSYGNFSYHWQSFGKSFKKFLCELNSDYLLGKFCDRDYFDNDKYLIKCKKEIIQLRKHHDISKQKAREIWGFFEYELIDESYDIVCRSVCCDSDLIEIYDGEVWNSIFYPEKEYGYDSIQFCEEVFPCFVEILKEEVKENE